MGGAYGDRNGSGVSRWKIILGGDDDTFLAIGNAIIGQLGGIHGFTTSNFSTTLDPGTYELSIFYADRHQVGAELGFSVVTPDVSISAPAAVPGPVAGAGLPGLILAGGGLLGWWRRKRKA